MQCGLIRHEVPTSEGPAREVYLRLDVRETQFAVAGATETPIHELFRRLVEDDERTALVCDDVIKALP